jgi:hypothetical protein
MGARPAGSTALVEKKRSSAALPILTSSTVARQLKRDSEELKA